MVARVGDEAPKSSLSKNDEFNIQIHVFALLLELLNLLSYSFLELLNILNGIMRLRKAFVAYSMSISEALELPVTPVLALASRRKKAL